MPGTTSGVSGVVQFDADVMCFNEDEHEDAQRMIDSGETSDKGNSILECPECDVRRAANLRVVPVGGGE